MADFYVFFCLVSGELRIALQHINPEYCCDSREVPGRQSVAGLVGTFYFFAYGIGQVVNGLLCKRYNKKFCIAASLFVSAAVNAALFFSPAFSAFKWLWLVNGVALSVLWSSLVAILSAHLDGDYLKRGVLLMSMSVAAGTCISYGTSALFLKFATYRAAFLFAALFTGAFAVCWILCYDFLTKPLLRDRAAERAAMVAQAESGAEQAAQAESGAEQLAQAKKQAKKQAEKIARGRVGAFHGVYRAGSAGGDRKSDQRRLEHVGARDFENVVRVRRFSFSYADFGAAFGWHGRKRACAFHA